MLIRDLNASSAKNKWNGENRNPDLNIKVWLNRLYCIFCIVLFNLVSFQNGIIYRGKPYNPSRDKWLYCWCILRLWFDYSVLKQHGPIRLKIKIGVYYCDQNDVTWSLTFLDLSEWPCQLSSPDRTLQCMNDILSSLCIPHLSAEARASISASSSNSSALRNPIKRKWETRGWAQRRLCMCGHGWRERNGTWWGKREGGQWIRVMGRKGRAQLPSFIPPVLLPLSLLSQPAGPQPQREDFPFSLLPPCSFLFIRFHAMPAKTTPSSCPEWLWSPLQRGTFSQRAMKEPFRWCWPCFDLSIQWEQESQVQLVSLWETDWPALAPHLYTRVEKWWQRVALVCSRFCPRHLCLECPAQLNSPNCLITSWEKNPKPKQRRTLQEKTGNTQLWKSTWIVSYRSIFQVFNLRLVQNCWQASNTAIILSDLCFDM